MREKATSKGTTTPKVQDIPQCMTFWTGFLINLTLRGNGMREWNSLMINTI